jgi:hypothetical protein
MATMLRPSRSALRVASSFLLGRHAGHPLQLTLLLRDQLLVAGTRFLDVSFSAL